MLKKGTMIWLKKGLGLVLLLMAASFIFNIDYIQKIIMGSSWISIGVLIISGYFLIISGRQL